MMISLSGTTGPPEALVITEMNNLLRLRTQAGIGNRRVQTPSLAPYGIAML